jgi:hypothetical protein
MRQDCCPVQLLGAGALVADLKAGDSVPCALHPRQCTCRRHAAWHGLVPRTTPAAAHCALRCQRLISPRQTLATAVCPPSRHGKRARQVYIFAPLHAPTHILLSTLEAFDQLAHELRTCNKFMVQALYKRDVNPAVQRYWGCPPDVMSVHSMRVCCYRSSPIHQVRLFDK